jgi:putative SOS response-associated peptidase YedK
MCGRASLTVDPEELRAAFGLTDVPPMAPRYNMAPSQPLPIIRQPHRLELVRWGLPRPGHGLGVNVRVETVARAPAYRESFWHRRCLVIVDGFYEWRAAGKTKQPFRIHRPDGKPFALAGIWQPMVTSDGEILDTCAILTGPANGVVAPLHDRMPLIVRGAGYERWLSTDARTPELLELVETDASTLVSYPVSSIVNDAKNDDPRCIAGVLPGSDG